MANSRRLPLLLAFLASAIAPLNAQHQHHPVTVITNVRVFNGKEMSSSPETVYITANGVISHSRPAHVDVVVDGNRKFLVPGLIESHAHPASTDDLAELASYGVTTVFILATFDFKESLALKNHAGLPDVFIAGVPAIGRNAGHARVAKQASDAAHWLLTPESNLTNYVQWNFGNGSDFLKVISQSNGPTLDQQREIVRLARERGKMVATHAVDLEAYATAVRSNAHSVHHNVVDAPLGPDIPAQMLANGQFAVPTLVLTKLVRTHAPLRAIFRGMGHAGASLAQALANARALHEAGVPLLAGTDAVSFLGITLPFGVTLQCELELFVEAGLSPAQALRSATSDAAKWQRLSDRGAILDGLRTDMLLLSADPTQDIANIGSIEKVWIGGAELPGPVRRRGGCANVKVGFKPWLRALGLLVSLKEAASSIFGLARRAQAMFRPLVIR